MVEDLDEVTRIEGDGEIVTVLLDLELFVGVSGDVGLGGDHQRTVGDLKLDHRVVMAPLT